MWSTLIFAKITEKSFGREEDGLGMNREQHRAEITAQRGDRDHRRELGEYGTTDRGTAGEVSIP